MAVAHYSLPLGSLFVLLAFGAGRWDRSGRLLMFLLITGFALALANPLLLSLIRCRVCGLRVTGSSFSRAVPREDRDQWLGQLEACPQCGDDGDATVESRERWHTGGG